jgi:hypothetical protein
LDQVFRKQTAEHSRGGREAGNVVNFDREKLEGITIQNGTTGSSFAGRTENGG